MKSILSSDETLVGGDIKVIPVLVVKLYEAPHIYNVGAVSASPNQTTANRL